MASSESRSSAYSKPSTSLSSRVQPKPRRALYDPSVYGPLLPIVGSERALYMDYVRSNYVRTEAQERADRLQAKGEATRSQFFEILKQDEFGNKQKVYQVMRKQGMFKPASYLSPSSSATIARHRAKRDDALCSSGTQTDLTCFESDSDGSPEGTMTTSSAKDHRKGDHARKPATGVSFRDTTQQRGQKPQELQECRETQKPTGTPTTTGGVNALSSGLPKAESSKKKSSYLIPSSWPPLRHVINSTIIQDTTSPSGEPLTTSQLQQEVLTLHKQLQLHMRDDRLNRLKTGGEVSIPLATNTTFSALRKIQRRPPPRSRLLLLLSLLLRMKWLRRQRKPPLRLKSNPLILEDQNPSSRRFLQLIFRFSLLRNELLNKCLILLAPFFSMEIVASKKRRNFMG